jgi:hypothetical protein
MAEFYMAKAFKRIRAESQREKVAIIEASRRKREAWATYVRRSAALNHLRKLFPSETAQAVSVSRRRGTPIPLSSRYMSIRRRLLRRG